MVQHFLCVKLFFLNYGFTVLKYVNVRVFKVKLNDIKGWSKLDKKQNKRQYIANETKTTTKISRYFCQFVEIKQK